MRRRVTPRRVVAGARPGSVSSLDRGLHYGDGLFETLPVRNGKPVLLEAHLDRLFRGLDSLGIAPQLTRKKVETAAHRAAAGLEKAVLKILVTRGAGARGYAYNPDLKPTLLATWSPWPEIAAEHARAGVNVGVCHVRLAVQPALAGLKHLNRLEQVLARREWQADWQEGLMLSADGHVVCGTQSNLFFVRDGALVTPALTECGVAGIMRDMVLRCARDAGLSTKIHRVAERELARTKEAFLTNSLIGLWPVRRLDGRDLTIGPVTRQIQALLYEKACVVSG
jgi:4-amino-4-deoxychorismate lyase